MATFHIGDPVIYSIQKHTAHPGPRAKEIRPQPKGEYYDYAVDKFWTVVEVYDDGSLQVVTRRGKTHLVHADDPHLRRANFWERIIHKNRFPSLAAS